MKIKQSLLAFYLLSSCFTYALVAQSTDYVKGRLYVKVKNEKEVILPEMRQEKDVILVEKMGLTQLAILFEDYEVYHLERSFRGLGSEDLENTYILKFRQEGFELALADRIMRYDFIDYAEVEPIYSTTFVPNDYIASQQWSLDKINATDAWDLTTGSEAVVIGVVDAGFLPSHLDLAANIWTNPGEIPGNGLDDDGNTYIDDVNGWDAGDRDPNTSGVVGFGQYFSHGTSVAGAASPVTNNNEGIAGIGYTCKIMPIKGKTDARGTNTTLTQQQRRSLDATFAGITYAVRAKPQVVNMSFGGSDFNLTVRNLITAGYNEGVIFVASAGNGNTSGLNYPAAYPHVINVGSTNSLDRKSSFSNYGSTIDIMAPGSSIMVLGHNNSFIPGYGTSSGTSFSSPIVAGLVGLMLSVNPCLTPAEVVFYLKNTALNIDNTNPSYRGQLGAGRIDAYAAVRAVMPNAAPAATFSYDSLRSCDGSIEFFYDGTSLACPLHMTWTFNGQTSSELNPVFTIPDTGMYTVALVVDNGIGSNQSSQTISINKVLTADAGGDTNGVLTACVGEAIILNSSTNTPGVTARWSPAAGINNPNLLTPTIGAIANRTYTLTVTDSTGCQATDEVDLLIVNSIDAGTDQVMNLGDTIQLQAHVVGSGFTYAWTPATGLSDPTLQNPKASPDRNTSYQFKATTFSGCELTDEVIVSVNGGVGLFGDFAAIGKVLPAYPNPASTEIYLSATLEKATTLKVTAYDLTGREIATLFDGKTPRGDVKIHWQKHDALRAGIYMLVWQTPEARFVQKVEWK